MRSQYSISWLYGEFTIGKFNRSKAIGSWSAPYVVNTIEDFERALIEAKEALHINKQSQVSIVYDADNHNHSFLELPPMKSSLVEKYIARISDKEKTFDGEAVWSYRVIPAGSHQKGVLLHLLPKIFFKNVMSVCQKYKLEVNKLVPFTELLKKRLPVSCQSEKDIIISVVMFKQNIQIVLSDAHGESYFVRELSYGWKHEKLDRLKLDIERTLLFAKQQKANVQKIQMMGVKSQEITDFIKSGISIPICADEQSASERFCIETLLGVADHNTSNYIPNSFVSTLTRRATINVSFWATAASVAIAVSSSMLTDLVRMEGNEELVVNVQILENELADLRLQNRDISQEQSQIESLLMMPDPVPAWFLYDLGNVLPDAMFLSKADIQVKAGKWVFVLEGATKPTLANSISDLESLEKMLQSPPWQANISPKWRKAWLEMLQQGKANDDGLLAFTLEGSL